MFFRARVTVAVLCSLSWLSAMSVSYCSTRGFTITDCCGPSTSRSGAYVRSTDVNGGRLWSKKVAPSCATTSISPAMRNTSSVTGGAGAARDDQLPRPEPLHVAQHRAERVRLGDTGDVLRRRPGVVRLY